VTGYYVVEIKLEGMDWFDVATWEMETYLLPDFLLHILDIHRATSCRDDFRVRRVEWANAQWEYLGFHFHTSVNETT
jgi:hypothetical protein